MSSQLESLIERVLGELRHIVQTETIIGEPIQAGDVLLIPVSKISFGFGAGGQGTRERAARAVAPRSNPSPLWSSTAMAKSNCSLWATKRPAWGN